MYNTELDDSILKRADPRVNAHLYQLLDIGPRVGQFWVISDTVALKHTD
jgi:hypothetical protein